MGEGDPYHVRAGRTPRTQGDATEPEHSVGVFKLKGLELRSAAFEVIPVTGIRREPAAPWHRLLANDVPHFDWSGAALSGFKASGSSPLPA